MGVQVISPCSSLASSGEWPKDPLNFSCDSVESLPFAEWSSSGEFYSPVELINHYKPPPENLTNRIKELSAGFEAPASALNKELWLEPLKAFCREIKDLPLSENPDCPYDNIRGLKFSHLENVSGNYMKLGSNDEPIIAVHQMPVAQTMHDIFESIYLHKCPVMVCLSSTQDVAAKKCMKYWKGYKLDKKTIESKKTSETSQKLKKRTLSYNGHKFIHLHLDLWNDENVDPDPELLFALIKCFCDITEANEGIPFDHCSGGINRSRFFAILAQVYRILKDNPDAEINVPELIMYSLLHRRCMNGHVLTWLEKYIQLMAEWMSKK